MANRFPPIQQLELLGVHTAGNPANRPRGTAQVCTDFRIMPGQWLRHRTGRVARYNIPSSGVCRQIFPFRTSSFAGSDNHLAQVSYSGSVKWHWFSLLTYVIDPTGIETISTSYDGGLASSTPVAATNLNDRPIFYNGLGVRGGSDSKPPFSSYNGGQVRYFGLDAYCPSGNPSVGFASGAGHNTVTDSIDIWVGLYDSSTEHYSNAVKCGAITATSGTGTITVSNLDKLKYATHGSGETATLYYVFYATIDGANYKVPYLILASDQLGPLKVAVTSTTASLSVTAYANGFWIDATKEAPQENFPPRPMRMVTFVNGRLYGIPIASGSGGAVAQTKIGDSVHPDFTYVPDERDQTAIVWSKAAGDDVTVDALGDPLQCWPLRNLAYVPTNQFPLYVGPSPNEEEGVIVLTASACFLLEELADGQHRYTKISRIHGVGNAASVKMTDYGLVWMTQRRQIVLLPTGSHTVRVLSKNYQSIISANAVSADYVINPTEELDQYKVSLADSTVIVHDFKIANEQFPDGQGYKYTSLDYTAMATALDSNGKSHHIVAKTGLYTEETQPENGLTPAVVQTFTSTDQTIGSAEVPQAVYQRNWDDMGDKDLRKDQPWLDILGDGAITAALSNTSPLTVEWYADYEQVTSGNKKTTSMVAPSVHGKPGYYRFRLTPEHKHVFKFVLKMTGHYSDLGTGYYPDPSTEGDLASNFHGSILGIHFEVGIQNSRP